MYSGISILDKAESEMEKQAFIRSKFQEPIRILLEKTAALNNELNQIQKEEAFWIYRLMLKYKLLLKANKAIIKMLLGIRMIFIQNADSTIRR